MATPPPEASVNTCILYWGIRGAGKRSCLEQVASKLRPDHRGEKQEVPTRSERGETYPVLPIELGKVGGVRTRIDVELEHQNRDLLASMNRRAQLQLRLQQTVEGLSVAAIGYYVVGLFGYVAKGVEHEGFRKVSLVG